MVKPGGLQHAQLSQTLLNLLFSHAGEGRPFTCRVLLSCYHHRPQSCSLPSRIRPAHMEKRRVWARARDTVVPASPADRMEKGNGGANTHWWVENRLQLCHKVIMAIKFCKNTKFLFGTFMNIQYLIFFPKLGFLFLTGIKEKKKMYLVSYSPSIVQTSPNPFQYTLIPCKYYLYCEVKNSGKH